MNEGVDHKDWSFSVGITLNGFQAAYTGRSLKNLDSNTARTLIAMIALLSLDIRAVCFGLGFRLRVSL